MIGRMLDDMASTISDYAQIRALADSPGQTQEVIAIARVLVQSGMTGDDVVESIIDAHKYRLLKMRSGDTGTNVGDEA